MPSPLDSICTPAEAADTLGISRERVLQFCREGRLAAKQFDRAWLIDRDSLKSFRREKRKPGRPKLPAVD